ncbi:MAG: tetratricopeptide repeat protein [Thermodesulfobacteria bacterium]|nr:tetratricopeptide repeat protein [Thermodesulfobacteriota bacterium]
MKNKKYVLFLILVSSLLLFSCASPSEKRDAFLKKGDELVQKHDYVRARLEYKNAIKVDPNCVKCYVKLAKVSLRLGDLKGAYKAYLTASELAPDRADLQIETARLLMLGHAPDKAEEKLREVLKKEPDNWKAKLLLASILAKKPDKRAEALSMLEEYRTQFPEKTQSYILSAAILTSQGKTNEAEALIKTGLKKCSDKKPLLRSLLSIYENQHRLKDALKVAQELTKLDPKDPSGYLILAQVYEQLGKRDKAEEAWNKALKVSGNKPDIILAYSQYLYHQKAIDKAQKVLENGIRQNPKSLKLRLALAELLTKTGKPQDAIKLLRETDLAQFNIDDQLKLRNAIAKILLSMGKTDEALAEVDNILKDDPQNAQALLLKARIALAKKDAETAIATLRQLVDDFPKKTEYRLLLAQAHILNNESKLAEDQLKQATRINPKDLGAWISLANLQLANKDLEGAIDTLSYALKENPQSAKLAYFLAQLYKQANDTRRAEQYLKMAIKLKPNWIEPYQALGTLYAQSPNKEETEAQLKQAVASHPESGLYRLLLATFYQNTGQIEKAIQQYEELLKIAPDYPLFCNNLAYLYAEYRHDSKSLEKAKKLIEKALSKLPNQPIFLDTKAWILYKSGKLQEALSIIDKALVKSKNPTLLYHKAVVLAQLGKKDAAKKILEELLAKKNNFSEREQAEKLLKRLS